MALQKTGIKLVVEGYPQAQAQLNAFQKSLNNLGGKTSQNNNFGKMFNNLNKEVSSSLQHLGKSIPGFGKLTAVLGTSATQTAALATALGTATVALGGITLAAGAAGIALAGFVAAGKRGVQIEVTAKAFGNAVAAFGDSTEVLKRLRQETRGTVSDFELMQLSVASLQGTSKEFRQTVAPELGRIIDATNRIAQASGQSAEVVRDKFLRGIRLQSKRLVDDTGAIIDLNTAYEKYAATLGKTAGSLTDLEKQAAFAAESIDQLEQIALQAGTNNFADAIARSSAFLKNLRDNISLAVLPAFKPLLGMLDQTITSLSYLLSFGAPLLRSFAKTIGTAFSSLIKIGNELRQAIFGGFAQDALSTLPYIIALFQFAAEGIGMAIEGMANMVITSIRNFRSVVGFFLAPFKQLPNLIGDLFKGTNDQFNNIFEQLAFNVGRGGANIIGAFAAGLLRAGTQVARAAAAIAQIVADFLVGFSPPKKGALSNIDQGAANVAKAWAEGFLGGIMPSVDDVANSVNQQLGVIGTFTLDQIKTRFGQLDLAVRPFSEQLQIAKANLEAIAGFIDPALKIAERQRQNLLKAFGRGEDIGIETLRTRDREIQRLKELKDLGQEQVDNAELQLGLASAQQAQERALLAIQQARLGTTEEASAAVEKATKEAKEAAAKGGGGGADTGEASEGGAFMPGQAPDLLANSQLDKAKQQILNFATGIASAGGAGIAQGLQESGFNAALANFQGAAGQVSSQLARAKGANPAQKILDKFSGLKDGISAILDPFQQEFTRVFEALFGEEGSISGFIDRWGERFANLFTAEDSPVKLAQGAIEDLASAFTDKLGAIDLTPFKTELNTTFGLDNEESPLAQMQNNVGLALEGAQKFFDTFKTKISEVFTGLFGEEGAVITALTDFDTKIIGVFDNLFKEGGVIDVLLGNFFLFVGSVIDLITEKFNTFTGTGEGSLRAALANLGTVLNEAAIDPFFNAGNALIQAVEDAINTVIEDYNKLPLPDIGWSANFGSIDRSSLPGYARGGLGVRGSFIAGEKGAELITTKKPVNVFPAAATRALMSMAAQPQPVYAGYGGNTNYNQQSYNSNVNINVANPQQAVLIERQQRSLLRA